MGDIHSTVGKIVAELGRATETYRLENDALRMLLLNRGLTKKEIDREVKKYRKQSNNDKTAPEVFRRVCRDTLEILRRFDAERTFDKIQIPGKLQ